MARPMCVWAGAASMWAISVLLRLIGEAALAAYPTVHYLVTLCDDVPGETALKGSVASRGGMAEHLAYIANTVAVGRRLCDAGLVHGALTAE